MGGAVGTIAGAALGSVIPGVGTALGATLGGAAGSLFGGRGGGSGGQVQGYYSDAAAQQAAAGNQAAAAQIEAARIAADAARFRPVGISSRFGRSRFGFDEQGNLTSAGYTPSQELLTLQNFYAQNALGGRADTERLLSLGRGYLSESPQEAQARFYQQQRALLAPGEEQALNQIRSNLRATGRGGLAVGQGGALAAANPELQAYYNAIAQRDLQAVNEAEQRAQQQITFGQNLLSSAYSPVSTPYSQVAALEGLAQSPLDLGAQLGGRAAQAGGTAGSLLAQGGFRAAEAQRLGSLAAAETGLAGNIAGAGITASRNTALNQQISSILGSPQVGQWFGGLFPGGGFGGGLPQNQAGGLFGGSQGGYNFGAFGRAFGVPGQTSTGLYTFD
jgi:hypothetical protein